MNRWTRAAVLLGAATATAAVLTACKSNNYGTAPAVSNAPAATAGAATTSLSATTNPSLGQIVTDANGFTLYRFDKDTTNPTVSNCNAACAALWPPVTGTPALTGIDASLLGSVTRADGTKQVTLKGWPLYRYAKDGAAGDTAGQGVGGIWHAVTPLGAKVTGAATVASPAPSSAPSPADTSGDTSSGY